jgi:FtsZ-binding cell division protein ZapB
MTRKHGIRSPKAPAGEDPKVTIELQEKQINLLIRRTMDLQVERDELSRNVSLHMGDIRRLKDRVAELESENDSMNRAHIRLLGWQDAVRELTPKFTLED